MSVYQVVVKGSYPGNQLRNIMHYTFPDYIPNSTELQEFVDGLDSDYKTSLQTYFHTSVTFSSYELRRVDVANLPSTELTPSAGSWSGNGAADRLPMQNCLLVTAKAPTVFPRTVRTFMFPMTENDNTGSGQPSSTVQSAGLNWGGNILTIPITGQADALRVAVKYTGTPRVVSSFNVVQTVVVSGNWATLRSRKAGVGI